MPLFLHSRKQGFIFYRKMEVFMLQIQNLTLTHQKDLRTIIENFTFSLQPGDKAVIIGEEGNGKSTLLKWLYDPALIEGYAQASGTRLLGALCSGISLRSFPKPTKIKPSTNFMRRARPFSTRLRASLHASPCSLVSLQNFSIWTSRCIPSPEGKRSKCSWHAF